MKQATKEKLAKAKVAVQKAGKVFWGWVPVFAAEAAILMGIDAWKTSRQNEKKLNKLTNRVNDNFKVQDHNWAICDLDHRVLQEMTRDNKELLERALGISSGEEPEEEKKEEEPAA